MIRSSTVPKSCLALPILFAAACGSSDDPSAAVMDIAVREVVDQSKFSQYLPKLVELTAKQSGYVTNREFLSFYALAPDPMPKNPVRMGLTQWKSVDSYTAAAGAIVADPVFTSYFPSVKGYASVLVKPYAGGQNVDVANIIGAGQVLEVAIRDLSKISDRSAFFAAKDGFVKILTSAKGVVREYEWVSAAPGMDYYVGMTVYESQAAFTAVSSDPKITASPEAAKYFMNYPPQVAQITTAAP